MKIASISKCHCPKCGFRGELCFTAREFWHKRCPDCGKVICPDDRQVERSYGNRRFTETGGESVTEGFHFAEVNLAKKLMPRSADCIRSDGRVVFTDSKSVKTYHRELAGAKRRLGVPTGGPF